MSNLEYIANCRIIYYTAISMYYGVPISVNDEFEQMITDFFCSSDFNSNYEIIKSLFVVKYQNKKFNISYPPELINIVSRKMDNYNNPIFMKEMYDSVGFEKTQKLTEAAIKTCEFINELYANNTSSYYRQ